MMVPKLTTQWNVSARHHYVPAGTLIRNGITTDYRGMMIPELATQWNVSAHHHYVPER